MFWHFAARVAAAALSLPALLFALRFFQQTGYNVARGYIRIALSRCFVCGAICVALLVPVEILLGDYSDAVLAGCSFASAAVALSVRAKVPLKFTRRATRLFVVSTVACTVGFLFLPSYLLPLLPFLVILPCALLLLPFERSINAKYIRQAEQKLSRAAYIKIAVTGSFGKTSVKNILTEMLSSKYKACCTPGSFNTPLGIASYVNNDLPCDAEAVVFEMGAKKRGDIDFLCKMVKPRYGILTGIEKQHLSTFGSVDNVIAAKGELLRHIPENGICVLNADNVYTRRLDVEACPTVTVGATGDVAIGDVSVSAAGTSFCLTVGGKKRTVKTRLLGAFNAINVALAAALAYELGVDAEDIFGAAERLKPVPHRLELIEGANGTAIIDDSYNANISGVRGALEVLSCFQGKRYVVTQGIVELGREQFEVNFGLGKELAAVSDAIVTLGQNCKALSQGARAANASAEILFADTVGEAASLLAPRMRAGDVILFQNDLPDSMI